MLSPHQIRAARALIKMEQATLAERAGVSTETIKRVETEAGARKAQSATLDAIKTALEWAGVEFIEASTEDGGPGAGVRLASDNHAAIRRAISAEVAKMVDNALSWEEKKNGRTELFEGSADIVFDVIMRDLNQLLKIRLRTLLD